MFKQLAYGKVNHVMRGPTIRHSTCGASPRWFDPPEMHWLFEDLSKPDCKKCLKGLSDDEYEFLTKDRRVQIQFAAYERRPKEAAKPVLVQGTLNNNNNQDLRLHNSGSCRFRGFGSDLRPRIQSN
jgi:hypothetical protein